jgi:hypothetical protein
MTLFSAYRSEISRGRKIAILGSYVAIVVLAASLIFLGETIYPDVIEINYNKFILGFQAVSTQLRFDFLFTMTILPVISPVLVMFTAHYEIHAYRLIPLLVFFSIGVGMFFSKKLTKLS